MNENQQKTMIPAPMPAAEAHEQTDQLRKVVATLSQALANLTGQAPSDTLRFAEVYGPAIMKQAIKRHSAATPEHREAAAKTSRAIRARAVGEAAIMGVKIEQHMLDRLVVIMDVVEIAAGILL